MVLELDGSTISDEENVAVGSIGKYVGKVVRVVRCAGCVFQGLHKKYGQYGSFPANGQHPLSMTYLLSLFLLLSFLWCATQGILQ